MPWRHASRSRAKAPASSGGERGAVGVERGAGAALALAARDLVGQGAAIRAVRRHGVVGISDRDDAADQRDRVAAQAARVAAAVEPFVVTPAAVDQAV